MDAPELKQIVRDVFGHSYRTTVLNGWLQIRCPLSQWTHEKGKDNRASAGISIKPNDVSVFNCFTCHFKAPLPGLLRKFSQYTGDDLEDLIEELEDEAYLGARSLSEWDDRGAELAPLVPLNKELYLDLYDSAAGHPYVSSRGISRRTAKKLQLMVDPCDPADGEERILFPVFGPDGELYGLSGRATNSEARLKVRDYHGLQKGRNVLGAHLIAQEKPDKVLIVEGLFDYANCWQHGYPAIAVMHSTFTDAQAEIVRGFSLPTYMFQDNDKAGQDGRDRATEMLCDYQPVLHVEWPDVFIQDPDDPDDEGHYLKDPGELLPEEFEQMIEGATLAP